MCVCVCIFGTGHVFRSLQAGCGRVGNSRPLFGDAFNQNLGGQGLLALEAHISLR